MSHLEEFEKSLRCLALELPGDIYNDVMDRWANLKAVGILPDPSLSTLQSQIDRGEVVLVPGLEKLVKRLEITTAALEGNGLYPTMRAMNAHAVEAAKATLAKRAPAGEAPAPADLQDEIRILKEQLELVKKGGAVIVSNEEWEEYQRLKVAPTPAGGRECWALWSEKSNGFVSITNKAPIANHMKRMGEWVPMVETLQSGPSGEAPRDPGTGLGEVDPFHREATARGYVVGPKGLVSDDGGDGFDRLLWAVRDAMRERGSTEILLGKDFRLGFYEPVTPSKGEQAP